MIIDPRFNRLAETLAGFSTALRKGERVLIDAFDIPDAFVIELVRAARRLGQPVFGWGIHCPSSPEPVGSESGIRPGRR